MGQKKKQKSYLKIGDLVQIISGKKKGILAGVKLINKKKQKILVQQLNDLDFELRIIHISNVMLWDSEKNKATRVGYKITDGQKMRYSKKSGNLI